MNSSYIKQREKRKKIKRVLDSILSTCLAGLVGVGIGGMFYFHLKGIDEKKEEYRKCLYQAPRVEYRVKNADTLWEICDDYGWRSVCIDEIERINGIDVLKADTFISIPDKKYANECYLKRFKK
jgi:hypothetical protein